MQDTCRNCAQKEKTMSYVITRDTVRNVLKDNEIVLNELGMVEVHDFERAQEILTEWVATQTRLPIQVNNATKTREKRPVAAIEVRFTDDKNPLVIHKDRFLETLQTIAYCLDKGKAMPRNLRDVLDVFPGMEDALKAQGSKFYQVSSGLAVTVTSILVNQLNAGDQSAVRLCQKEVESQPTK